ncbi:MAG: hypothetical protein JRM99_02310 [Nitrososphaerota archaeon]|nr:hypothetical protein [Nitrososphaerota archaeon]
MSFGGGSGSAFLDPLIGKTTTFVVEAREANIKFAQALGDSIAKTTFSCIVFDLDALYASNADIIFTRATNAASSFTVDIPGPGSDIESEFSSLLKTQQEVVIIDSLNTLYHLISTEDGSSKARKMMFALASLSLFARENHRAIVMSMYRRDGFAKPGKGRPISSLSDIAASVDVKGDGLEVKTERGSAWPRGVFSIRIP